MSNEKEKTPKQAQEAKAEQVVEVEQVAETESEIPPVNNKGTSLLSMLTVLLSFIAVGAVGIMGYFGYMQVGDITSRLVTMEERGKNAQAEANHLRSSIQNDVTATQKQIQTGIKQLLNENDTKLNDISTQLANTRRQLQSVGGRHQTDWLLAEADYLVRIATQRLTLQQDHVTAIALMLSADERIMLMDDPALQSVREAIARDLTTLRLIKRVDVAGLAIRVSSLLPQVQLLPVQSFELPEADSDEGGAPVKTTEATWQENLKKTLEELSDKWFDVRDHGKPVTPLMSSEKQSMLLTNMTVLLQTAQFAILQGHTDLYHHSLQQLKAWGNDYFDMEDDRVLAFMREIDSLNQMEVTVSLPATLESRLLLSREVEQRLMSSSRTSDDETSQLP
ncbi:MAG: hypothetical protein GY808_10370 [Gammaproteobacteria bacterium]|nr:hypothetical protein [Gammaproteobacteria bacterium]